MTFGEKLQALRKSRGWSQEQLAERIAVSRQAVSKWESEAAAPDTANVLEISRLFGKSESWARVTCHRARAKIAGRLKEGET